MKAANEGVFGRMGAAVRRVGGWVRRHPWRTVFAVPAAVVLYVAAVYPFTPSIGDIKKAKQEQPSVVLSADGKELAVFRRANRDWVKLSDISPKVTEALLATEDKRFYEHPGIDFVRTAKAMLNTIRGDREGGSTITQQLARNLYPEQIGRAPTITRKVKEAITALKIEAVYSKDEILETYLNSVSFLYNAWGIEMAARTYFDKPAKDLNEVEAATLVGMLKGTAYYNPVLNPERALERRNTVLAMMVKENKLDEARFEKLKKQPLKLDFSRIPEFNGPAPHLAESLRRWLIEWADEHDYNIYADGLVVRTTIDSRLQDMANQAVERQGKALQAVANAEWSRSGLTSRGTDPSAYAGAGGAPFEYFWNSHKDLVKEWIRDSAPYKQAREQGRSDEEALEGLRKDDKFMADLRRQKTMLQAGFLAIEPHTGYVRAWVGSRDYNEDKFDHVQQARRQPGSTFKPFVYGAAFEMGMQPGDTLMDAPVDIQIDRNKVWRPSDIHGVTNQPMTLRDALAQSKNTVTAQLMMRVGPSRVASLARAMGVRESKLDEVPSLALGTSPVTLKEMVTAFGTIANGGNYIEPIIVTAVEDRQHNVLASFGTRASEQALGSDAAMKLLDVMRGVIDGGTAASLRPRFGLQGDLAGKTGTTQDNTDGWFIVMHPQLVAGAWMGFNDARVTMRSEYWGQGAHNALLVVGDFLQQGMKARLVDPKATFAAPHLKDQEQPLVDKMGDWWNSVFNTPSSGSPDTEMAAVPETKLEPPVLEPPPQSVTTVPAPEPLPNPAPAVTPDAPVVVDAQPQRVPSFPRPLETAKPVDSIPGTQVYRSSEANASRPADASASADAAKGAAAKPPASGSTASSTSGSSSTRSSTSAGSPAYIPVPGSSALGASGSSPNQAGVVTIRPSRPSGNTSGSTSGGGSTSASSSGTSSSSSGMPTGSGRRSDSTSTLGASSSEPSSSSDAGAAPTASGSAGAPAGSSSRRESSGDSGAGAASSSGLGSPSGTYAPTATGQATGSATAE